MPEPTPGTSPDETPEVGPEPTPEEAPETAPEAVVERSVQGGGCVGAPLPWLFALPLLWKRRR
jgi:hypothetical protein